MSTWTSPEADLAPRAALSTLPLCGQLPLQSRVSFAPPAASAPRPVAAATPRRAHEQPPSAPCDCLTLAGAEAPELRALQLGSCNLGEATVAVLLGGTRSPGSRLEALDVSRTCSAAASDAGSSGTALARHHARAQPAGSASFGQVAQAITDAGPRLIRLSFNGVPLGPGAAKALGEALKQRAAAGRGVEALSVGSTGGGDALCEALSPTIASGTLRLVDLSDCGAGDAGLEAVAVALSSPACRAEDLRLGGNCVSAGDGMLGGLRIGRELALRACAAAVEAAAIVASGAAEDESAEDGSAIVASNARRSLPTVVNLTGRTMRSAQQAAREGAGEALAESLAGIVAGDVSVELADEDVITASPALAPVVQAAAVEALRAIGIDPVMQPLPPATHEAVASRASAAPRPALDAANLRLAERQAPPQRAAGAGSGARAHVPADVQSTGSHVEQQVPQPRPGAASAAEALPARPAQKPLAAPPGASQLWTAPGGRQSHGEPHVPRAGRAARPAGAGDQVQPMPALDALPPGMRGPGRRLAAPMRHQPPAPAAPMGAAAPGPAVVAASATESTPVSGGAAGSGEPAAASSPSPGPAPQAHQALPAPSARPQSQHGPPLAAGCGAADGSRVPAPSAPASSSASAPPAAPAAGAATAAPAGPAAATHAPVPAPAPASAPAGGVTAVEDRRVHALLMALESRTAEAERRAAAAVERAERAEAIAEASAAAAKEAATQAAEDRAEAAKSQAQVRSLASTVERLAARLDSIDAQTATAVAATKAAEATAARAAVAAAVSSDASSPSNAAGAEARPDPQLATALARTSEAAERAGALAESSQAQVAELTTRLGTLEEAVLREQADTIAALEAILASQTGVAQ